MIEGTPAPNFDQTLHLLEVCHEWTHALSLDTLPEKVIKATCDHFRMSFGVFYLLNDKGAMERVATHGFSGGDSSRIKAQSESITIDPHLLQNCGVTQEKQDIPGLRELGLPDTFIEAAPFLGMALIQGTCCQGYLCVAGRKDKNTFTKDEERSFEILAKFICAAVKNARLFDDLNTRDRILIRRNENLALLDQLAATLATSTEISQIMENGLVQLMDYLRLEVGEIFIRQEESKNINLVVHRGNMGYRLWARDHFVIGKGIVGEVVKTNTHALINPATEEVPDLGSRVRGSGITRVAVVPLAGRKGVIGVLCAAACGTQSLDDLEVQFLQAIGSWMATAIENVNLNTRGRTVAIMEERERIGMDLHDGIIQSIYAVGLTLEHARLLASENPEQSTKRIEQSISDLNIIIRDIRAYILDLRPRQLFNDSLMTGITRLVAEFKANTLLDVNLQGPADDLAYLPTNHALAMFHICQEALANVAKHAHARHVEVILWTTAERLLMEISDDGVGFDVAKTKVTIGHGLSNMGTRVTNVDGEVEITSEPGKGTTILAWIPLLGDDGLVDDYYE